MTETAGKSAIHNNVTITIDKDGMLTFNGKVTTDEQLGDLLFKVYNADQDTSVLIQADKTTQLERLAFVWDSCRRIGLNNVHIQSQ